MARSRGKDSESPQENLHSNELSGTKTRSHSATKAALTRHNNRALQEQAEQEESERIQGIFWHPISDIRMSNT